MLVGTFSLLGRVLSSQAVFSDLHSLAVSDLSLATGKYGCREVRVHPAECGEQLGRDP